MPSIQKRINYELLDTAVPAMSAPSVHFLSTHLQPNHVVFEWGSGASTFWFADRCNTVWSVEYFKDFYDELITRSEQYINVNLILKEPDEEPQTGYIASHSSAKGLSFKDFAYSINNFKDQYFDVIVIDGRARCACLDLALPKLREGGIIVFDDTNRAPYMNCVMRYADSFKKVLHFEGRTVDNKLTTTSVLYKKL